MIEQPNFYECVARALAEMWADLRPLTLGAYVHDNYGVEAATSECVALHILQCADGSMPVDSMSGRITGYWNIDDRGFRAGYEAYDPEDGDGVVYRHPVLKFYVEKNTILISERLGPGLLSRKVGTVSLRGETAVIHSVLLRWRMSPNQAFCMKANGGSDPEGAR